MDREEDSILMALSDKIGNKWRQMTYSLPGRTENQIKNRYKAKVRELQQSPKSTSASQASPVSEMLSPTIDMMKIPEYASSYQNIMEMSFEIEFDNFFQEEAFSFESKEFSYKSLVGNNIDSFLSY